jgi:hypothetical protein
VSTPRKNESDFIIKAGGVGVWDTNNTGGGKQNSCYCAVEEASVEEAVNVSVGGEVGGVELASGERRAPFGAICGNANLVLTAPRGLVCA